MTTLPEPALPATQHANEVTADAWGLGQTPANTYKIRYNRMTATTTDQGPSVGISVSYYGNLCVNADLSLIHI